MKIQLRKTNEREQDTIGIMQAYLGVLYFTGAMMFGSGAGTLNWGWFL